MILAHLAGSLGLSYLLVDRPPSPERNPLICPFCGADVHQVHRPSCPPIAHPTTE